MLSGLARDPRPLDVHLVDRVLEPVVGLADPRRRERVRRRNVAAGGEVGLVDRAHDVRPRQVEQIRIVQQVARVVGEPLAAEVGLVEAAVLQEHAPGTVEHEDPFPGDACDVCCDVASHGSLGVW
jgi:hypothetical protein